MTNGTGTVPGAPQPTRPCNTTAHTGKQTSKEVNQHRHTPNQRARNGTAEPNPQAPLSDSTTTTPPPMTTPPACWSWRGPGLRPCRWGLGVLGTGGALLARPPGAASVRDRWAGGGIRLGWDWVSVGLCWAVLGCVGWVAGAAARNPPARAGPGGRASLTITQPAVTRRHLAAPQLLYAVDGPPSTPAPATPLDRFLGFAFVRFDVAGVALTDRPGTLNYAISPASGGGGGGAPLVAKSWPLPARGEAWRWLFYRCGLRCLLLRSNGLGAGTWAATQPQTNTARQTGPQTSNLEPPKPSPNRRTPQHKTAPNRPQLQRLPRG